MGDDEDWHLKLVRCDVSISHLIRSPAHGDRAGSPDDSMKMLRLSQRLEIGIEWSNISVPIAQKTIE